MTKIKSLMWITLISSFVSSFFSCNEKNAAIAPVEGFKVDKYLGKWYEIARLDHKFERGLSNTTAEYSLMENGKIKVINKGLKANGSWSSAEGKAKFKSDTTVGLQPNFDF